MYSFFSRTSQHSSASRTSQHLSASRTSQHDSSVLFSIITYIYVYIVAQLLFGRFALVTMQYPCTIVTFGVSLRRIMRGLQDGGALAKNARFSCVSGEPRVSCMQQSLDDWGYVCVKAMVEAPEALLLEQTHANRREPGLTRDVTRHRVQV